MSLATAHRLTPPRNRVVLIGQPRPSPRRSDDSDAVTVVGTGYGNWQDLTTAMAAACMPGAFKACGCAANGGGCSCGVPGQGGTPKNTQTTSMGLPPDACGKARWIPLTINNNAVVAAGAVGSVSFAPQTYFKLARMTLSAAQAADFTGIGIQVGPTINILPAPVDGTYFSVASNQDGDGRVDAPVAAPGQLIIVTFTSTAGVAAGAARFTLQGAYAGQLDSHY